MFEPISTFLQVVALVMAALLPLINPPGAAPIFLQLTPGMSEAERGHVASRIARDAFMLLAAATLVGSYVLLMFGLSLPVIRIAGGLLVVATAWRLIGAEEDSDKPIVPRPSGGADVTSGWTFYPLTFPLTVGPGSLSVAVTLGAGIRQNTAVNVAAIAGAFAGIFMVTVMVYLAYRFASRLVRVLGPNGTVVLLRLSSFILLAIGVQILCDGLAERFAIGG